MSFILTYILISNSLFVFFSEKVLSKTLWGDYYANMKTKKIMKGASANGKKPLFVSLILDNIWAVYEAIKDSEKILKIITALNIKVAARDLRSTDMKQKLSAVFSQWLPLTKAVLNMVIKTLPSPKDITSDRAEQLMCSKAARFDSLAQETQNLKNDFLNCDPESDDLIVFVSKMFPVPKKQLRQNRPKVLSAEEMAQRREAAIQVNFCQKCCLFSDLKRKSRKDLLPTRLFSHEHEYLKSLNLPRVWHFKSPKFVLLNHVMYFLRYC